MIIFFESGQLGNQLFQYNGIRKYFPKQRIIFFGCEALLNTIAGVNAFFVINDSGAHSFAFKVFRYLFFFLARLRIICDASEVVEGIDYKLNIKRGIFLNLILFNPSYFQHNCIVEKTVVDFKLRPELLSRANDWLLLEKAVPADVELVFVHIRRGDYLHWPSRRSPAVLTADWYRRAIIIMKQKVKNPFFVFLSDDPWYVLDVFGESDDQIVSDNEMGLDLALMSLCRHGIMSASSFAWWGGQLARSKQDDKAGFFLAPKYWVGYRMKTWSPEGFKLEWINYLD